MKQLAQDHTAKKAELGIEDPTKTDKPKEENEAPSEDIPKEKEVETEKAKAALTHREMTRQEAESTPEALKVKRAKARAAYREAQTATPDIPMPSQTKKA